MNAVIVDGKNVASLSLKNNLKGIMKISIVEGVDKLKFINFKPVIVFVYRSKNIKEEAK